MRSRGIYGHTQNGRGSGYRSDEGHIAKELHCHRFGSRGHRFREDCDNFLRPGGHTQQVGRLLSGVYYTDVAPPIVNGVDHSLIAGWFLDQNMDTRVAAMELDHEMCRFNCRGSDPHDPQLSAEHADDGFRCCLAVVHFHKRPPRRPENALPAGVNCTPLEERSKSRKPSSRSSRATAWESAGWLMCSAAAASVKVP